MGLDIRLPMGLLFVTLGVMLAGFDLWCNALFRFSPFGTLRHAKADYQTLRPFAGDREYDKPDGVTRYDRTGSVYLSNITHDEDQPVHLRLRDAAVPIRDNLPKYGEPARLYCPAAVYEVVKVGGAPQFRINAANCVQCKTCDIKDPSQNIDWVPPEGGSGPNYAGM